MEHPRFPVYVMDLSYPEMGLSDQTGTSGSTTLLNNKWEFSLENIIDNGLN